MKNRRHFLVGALATAVTGLPVRRPAHARSIAPGKPLSRKASRVGVWSWDEFLSRCRKAANKMVGDRSQEGQDVYLHTLGSFAARLGELPEVDPRGYKELDPTYALQPFLHRSEEKPPIIVSFWRMEPGAVFPAHCHPSVNVCTLCTGGRGIIRNYDLAPGAPHCWTEPEGEFDVIETRAEILRPGSVNLASEMRDNIHRFEAGSEGMEGIDITTVYAREGKKFSYLRLSGARQTASGERRHRGRWVGKDVADAV